MPAHRPTIFVSIASYRDPDCQNTVLNLFERACHPERVFIGICWQFVPGEDDDCFRLQTRPDQVRTIEVHASRSQGACWARHQVQTLYQGEDYYFQIDSHMRFVDGWDERLITMLAACPSARPVLSTYPLAFTPPDELAEEALVTIYPKEFDEHGVLAQRSTLTSLDRAPDVPQARPFIGAGMVFGPGSIVSEVPYDPYLYFEGEEITWAVRLWTHGWDIFMPNAAVAFHDYGKRPERPRHWKDQTDWVTLNQRSRRRIRHLLGIERATDPQDLIDIQRYGLGTVRSLAEYEAFARLDFRARLCEGVPLVDARQAADQPEASEQRVAIFDRIWRENLWGCTETRSGHGSTMVETAGLRQALPAVLRFLNVRQLVDAGCGDVHWLEPLLPELSLYMGFDIVPELLAANRQRLKGVSHALFGELDLVMQGVPQADAILCRDVLTHLPLDAVLMILRRFRDSGCRHLLATHHDTTRNVWIRAGGWQPINLCAAPFNLPPPRLVLPETGSKQLAVWALADVPV